MEQPSPVSTGGMQIRAIGSGAGLKLYKNTKTKKFSNEQDLFGKSFLIKDNLEIYDWKLEDESKVIGKYLCFKATASREVEDLSLSFSSADNNEESKEPKKTIKREVITAWYTLDIPVSNGPDDYWGLPGLILELHDGDNTTYLCSKIVMNTNDKIEEPKNGKEVTNDEYQEIMEKKMIEMREKYSGRESKHGEGGFQIRMGG